MDPVAGPSPLYNRHVISNITLGLMHDSGWYIPDYSKAGYLAWGKGAGCDFLTQNCLEFSEQHIDQKFFCNEVAKPACVPDSTAVGQCSSNDQTMNGCMMVEPFVNTDCLQQRVTVDPDDLVSSIFLESFGPQSRCVGVEAPLFRESFGFNILALPFRCYKQFCIEDELYLDIGGVSARYMVAVCMNLLYNSTDQIHDNSINNTFFCLSYIMLLNTKSPYTNMHKNSLLDTIFNPITGQLVTSSSALVVLQVAWWTLHKTLHHLVIRKER